jgi:UDP-N-acetylmuramoylalanine--D-glutamate ligase
MDYNGVKVLIMGLGLHGGGLESALFFIKRGAVVTITDLKDETKLISSVKQLEAELNSLNKPGSVRLVLGKHETCDFKNADIVIKNPGVRSDSEYLKYAKHIETDISVFLSQIEERSRFALGDSVSTALSQSTKQSPRRRNRCAPNAIYQITIFQSGTINRCFQKVL